MPVSFMSRLLKGGLSEASLGSHRLVMRGGDGQYQVQRPGWWCGVVAKSERGRLVIGLVIGFMIGLEEREREGGREGGREGAGTGIPARAS
jgi:hypothetical protein